METEKTTLPLHTTEPHALPPTAQPQNFFTALPAPTGYTAPQTLHRGKTQPVDAFAQAVATAPLEPECIATGQDKMLAGLGLALMQKRTAKFWERTQAIHTLQQQALLKQQQQAKTEG
eukprot:TRINITY_DN68057_c1_g4_i1.p1 TRINITY_DN68057_c1_g4~~TRINITY_DN68057_c1_g4_i1.p1  ORF type:complete len:118 (-),score=17.87 TRINITY_DN68057_c1_g4_i1:88-441(-)